ncbi:unnamed protein product [Rhizoctonia solani]|uniref:Zn(2)-C6 fungal-type domain-containing protein n=1 Tax=Rhizoctonia solani TaxID=456999 RepID=A0A8H2XME7_9AGAM|nr:unnamed protein product [Rhizoctonia solani]CAE6430682.1 unnamed protein product [Rhizoctonia solani]
MAPRSTAGCYTCKQRKKKCDETKPQCLRCIRSRRECEGYAPLENPDSRGVMRRARAGPTEAILSQLRLSTSNSIEQQYGSPANANTLDQWRSSDISASQWSTGHSTSTLPSEITWHPNAATPTSLSLVAQLPTGLPASTPTYRDPGVAGGTIISYRPDSGDYSMPFQMRRWPDFSTYPQFTASDWPHGLIWEAEEDDNLENDKENTMEEMYIAPVLDPNTPDNTLPFILQSYARWIKLVLFEPGKGAYPMKNNIVSKFMRSPGERPRIILLANAVGSLGKSIKPSQKATALITYLGTEAYQHLNNFISDKSASDREVDRRSALDALDLVMEVLLIQRYFHPLLTLVKFMEAVAPVFRRACPEPMDQYPNLPRAVMSRDINIRNFVMSDVILSATSGRPMLFRYDTTCPPDILELINDGRYGIQWLHGIPDQYIIILGRINVLAEEREFGAPVNAECVAEIENQIREVETMTERSADPVSVIWKYTVRECWRMIVYAYLYMVLCRASTDDPRVIASVKSYVCLVQAVKPGRHPDAFLYIPMIIAGAAAHEKQAREIIRCRMLGLQECVNPGGTGYDVMSILMDLWTRTDAENRPSFWSDFRMSMFRVTGA